MKAVFSVLIGRTLPLIDGKEALMAGQKEKATALVEAHRIEQAILWIRKRRVMLDTDLAALYGVPTKVLNQAVKRNRERFPPDFMFRLNRREKEKVVTDCDHLGR